MSDLIPSPSEVLAERISDIETSRSRHTSGDAEKWAAYTRAQHALNCAGLIAINAVHSAAEAGNVQCKTAQREMSAFLKIALNQH